MASLGWIVVIILIASGGWSILYGLAMWIWLSCVKKTTKQALSEIKLAEVEPINNPVFRVSANWSAGYRPNNPPKTTPASYRGVDSCMVCVHSEYAGRGGYFCKKFEFYDDDDTFDRYICDDFGEE